jgi:hypothetical protein
MADPIPDTRSPMASVILGTGVFAVLGLVVSIGLPAYVVYNTKD